MSIEGAPPSTDIGLQGPVAGPLESHPELKPTLAVKLGYGLGQIIESVLLTIAGFLLFYYTTVLGAPGGLVGLALFLGLFFDAAVDPAIGSISDNIRSRFGRRLPLMLVGAPLMALFIGLMFAPPAGLDGMGLVVWLALTSIAMRTAQSIFVVPYVALGAELATGYEDRSSVVAWRTVIGTGAIVGTTVVAYSVFFAGADGLKRPEGYPGYGWTMGGLVLVAGLACCRAIWRQAAALPRAITVPGALHRRLPGEVAEVLRNRSFRILFLSSVIFYVAQALHGALNTHVYLYVWRLPSEMIQFTAFAYLAGIIGGVPFVAALARRWEKRTIVVVGLGMVCLSQTLMASLRAAGLFTLEGAEVLPWLCLNVAFAGLGVAFAAVAYPAMMADAADEHEHLFGFRREGLYFAGLGFSSKAAAGVGVLLAGIMLDVIRWPAELARQAGAAVPEEVLVRLTLGWGPLAAGVSVVSLVVLLGYSISRRRHAEIAVALGRRPAAA